MVKKVRESATYYTPLQYIHKELHHIKAFEKMWRNLFMFIYLFGPRTLLLWNQYLCFPAYLVIFGSNLPS